MSGVLARGVAEAYCWQRRLGAHATQTPFGWIVADPLRPEVWESNHVQAVTAATDGEIDALFAAMESRLSHTPWRVAFTDGFTPDIFLARLGYDGFREHFLTIQMALEGPVRVDPAPLDFRPAETDADWAAFAALLRLNHVEGRATEGMDLPPEFTADMAAVYRAKAPEFRFRLAFREGEAVAYGACGAAPNGFGIVEDIFTHPDHRRRGVASAMIAALAADLRAQGCATVFLGALAGEEAKRLYAKLGFRPVGTARIWAKELPAA